VLRVEDGSLYEITEAFLDLVKRKMVRPGSLIMLGSLTQLARVGTAFYVGEWCKARDKIMRELGDVLVVPSFPLLSDEAYGQHLVRSLAEFMDWFDDLPDSEAGLLKVMRREYCFAFLPQQVEGEQYGDVLQNFMLPISLNSEGLTLYKSRQWGNLGMGLRMVSEEEETEWLLKISAEINSLLRLSLATAVSGARTLSAVRAEEDGSGQLVFKVVGASNAARTAAALTRKGEEAEKVGKRGWSLASEEDVASVIVDLKSDGMQGKVLILHCMDNGSFFSMSRSGVSSLPVKKDRKFHIPGKLVVATGCTLEMMVEQMLRVADEVRPDLTIIVTPMPRYMDPCCEEHGAGKSEEELEVERQKMLKAVWGMKRETFAMVAKAHVKNVIVVSPMEALEVRSDVDEVRGVMADGVHLDERALDVLVDHVLKKVEEHFVSRKRGPTERAAPDGKRPRIASDGGRIAGGGRGGRGGRGGGGGWRNRFFSQY
jgi:hypothetical protein